MHLRFLREPAACPPLTSRYVAARLGPGFTEQVPWTLDDIFPHTSASAPIIFILSQGACVRARRRPDLAREGLLRPTMPRGPLASTLAGADPTATLQRFGEHKGWSMGSRLHLISLGQGQGPLAESIVKQAASVGDWVCLQNCHLAASWMPRLEEKVRGHPSRACRRA